MTAASGGIRFGRGGQPYAALHADDGSTAEVYLHGAHLTSWTTADGTEQLYLSEQAVFDGYAPIRGGVPVIFPQFAAEGALPKHGFARTMPWTIVDAPSGTSGEVTLELRDSHETRAVWDMAFVARLHVRLAGGGIALDLVVRNTGTAAMHFTAALHSYLATPGEGSPVVRGLAGCSFREAGDGPGSRRLQRGDLAIDGEINRVYFGVPEELIVDLPDRALQLRSSGLPDLVVWNPGAAGAAGLPDMPAVDASRMLCLEPAAIDPGIDLPPGGEWRGIHQLRAVPIGAR